MSISTGASWVDRGEMGPDLFNPRLGTWLTSLVLTTLIVLTVQLVSHGESCDTMPIMHRIASTTLSTEYPTVMLRTSGQIRRLLMLAGDIESNPGPEQQAADDGLIAGLADLVGQAPAGMRDVLCVWSPQRPQM